MAKSQPIVPVQFSTLVLSSHPLHCVQPCLLPCPHPPHPSFLSPTISANSITLPCVRFSQLPNLPLVLYAWAASPNCITHAPNPRPFPPSAPPFSHPNNLSPSRHHADPMLIVAISLDLGRRLICFTPRNVRICEALDAFHIDTRPSFGHRQSH